MKRKFSSLGGLALGLPLIVSCNIFSPFQGDGSAQDHLEAGMKCESAQDYACAFTEYQQLPAGALQSEKLCKLDLTAGGLTLGVILDTLVNQTPTASLPVDIATNLMPFDTARLGNLARAASDCKSYMNNVASDSDGAELGRYLYALGLISHCSMLIAKTTSTLGVTDDTTGTCATASTSTSLVKANIYDSAATPTGSAEAGKPGMCAADVAACVSDITSLTDLHFSKYQGFGQAVTAIVGTTTLTKGDISSKGLGSPSASEAAVQAARVGIVSTFFTN